MGNERKRGHRGRWASGDLVTALHDFMSSEVQSRESCSDSCTFLEPDVLPRSAAEHRDLESEFINDWLCCSAASSKSGKHLPEVEGGHQAPKAHNTQIFQLST